LSFRVNSFLFFFIIIHIDLEMSDERTLRDDLIIREGSSPENRRGN